MEHSKLPWKVAETNGYYDIDGPNGNPIATCGSADHGMPKANARFIVQACNAHEAMVGLLEELRGQGFMETHDHYTDKIDEALALANTGE